MFAIQVYGESLFVRLEVYAVETEVGRRIGRVDVFDEEGPYSRLSVSLPHEPALPTPDHFWLKDWSENAELARALLASGHIVIDDAIKPVESGYVLVRAARIA